MCHKEHNVSVVACVEGCQRPLRCEGIEGGRWSRPLKLWLTAPCYNYTLSSEHIHSWVITCYALFPSSPSCANLSYVLHWHVFPDLVLVRIQLVLENQTKHDTALHHLAWWCHDIINTLLKLCPTFFPTCLVSHEHVGVCLCMCKSVTFFRGWVVTGHVFKTPPLHIVKLNQTMQHRSWVWMGGCVPEHSTLSASISRSTLADRAFMVEVLPSGWLVPLALGVKVALVFQRNVVASHHPLLQTIATPVRSFMILP